MKTLDVFIPIRKPFYTFEKEWEQDFEPAVKELLNFLNCSPLTFEYFPPINIQASLLEDVELDPKLAIYWAQDPFQRHVYYSFLHLIIPFVPTLEHEQLIRKWNPKAKFSKKDFTSMMLFSLVHQIERRFTDVMISLSIANPSSIFHIGKGTIFYKKKLIHEMAEIWMPFHDVQENIKKIGWPKISHLELNLVWVWMSQIPKQDDVSSRISRAVSAYSYLLQDSPAKSDTSLIWAVMGIEALYTTGNTGLLQQIKDKSALVIGCPAKYKTKLSAMYAFRSKLIHGSAELPRKHYENDFENKFNRDYTESSDLAIAMLISTFQYLASNNIHTFEFNYELAN